MIKIVKTNEILTVTGHSNTCLQDKTEQTIQACACVTTAVQMMLFGIENIVYDDVRYEIAKGHFLLDVFHLKKEDSFLLLDTFMFTVKQLQQVYPDCIEVLV